jgi:aspartate/tyrosine/aromatic aminotransferase
MSLARDTSAVFVNGKITALYCKRCGTQIADVNDKGELRRFSNYAEIKMRFTDKSSHISNGCKSCLTSDMSNDDLKELHDADMREAPTAMMIKHLERKPQTITVISTDQRGIQ